MNIALIVLIAFFSFGFLNAMTLVTKSRSRRRRTKTNIALQKSIGSSIAEIISVEIESQLSSGLSRCEAVNKLYDKYHIPHPNTLSNSAYEGYAHKNAEVNLCLLLTKRELVRYGYAFSYNEKDSDWQETQKKNERFKDIKNKFPWL